LVTSLILGAAARDRVTGRDIFWKV